MRFASERDYLNLNPIVKENATIAADYSLESEKLSFEIDDLFSDTQFDDDLFVDAENPEVTESIGRESLNYLARDLLSRMGHGATATTAEPKTTLPSYHNIVFKATKAFVEVSGNKDMLDKQRLMSKYSSTSTNAFPVFIRGKGSFLKFITKMTHEQLQQLDKELAM
jgi:hypothetical protein